RPAAAVRRRGRRTGAGHSRRRDRARPADRAHHPGGVDVSLPDWVDALGGTTEATSIGYPVLFGGVLLGSIVPVVPTGAVVGAAAAFAMTTDSMSLPLVLVVATVAALMGDLITFAVCRFGGPAAVRWVARGQHTDRLEEIRDQFRRHGWQLIVAGRLLPAGRI